MAATSAAVLDQALTFNGDATSIGSVAMIPDSVRGHYTEIIIYIIFSSATSAGKVQIETASDYTYTGTWAAVGSTIDWAANTSQKYAAITGVFGALRLRVTTAATSGTVSAWIVASSPG
jgi:hypothetical protein